jgi:hypothetical protein
MDGYLEDVATWDGRQGWLRIAGRPRPGTEELLVLLEEPGEPVLLHWRDKQLIPHFRRDCPHCNPTSVPKPMYYIGGCYMTGQPVIVELTPKCFRTAEAAAIALDLREQSASEFVAELFSEEAPTKRKAVFVGLLLRISRGNYERSPRVLRCTQRVAVKTPWAYRTREELARIWGVPIRPRLFKGEQSS